MARHYWTQLHLRFASRDFHFGLPFAPPRTGIPRHRTIFLRARTEDQLATLSPPLRTRRWRGAEGYGYQNGRDPRPQPGGCDVFLACWRASVAARRTGARIPESRRPVDIGRAAIAKNRHSGGEYQV